MKFSIYDFKNGLIGQQEGGGWGANKIYVGTTSTEAKYERPLPTGAQPDPDRPGGGKIGLPYTAEFNFKLAEGEDPPTGEVTFSVRGAKFDGFDADGKPTEPADGDFVDVGTLTVPALEAEEMTYRVAFSDSKYKWFTAAVAGTTLDKVACFLMRG
jgi:hypothetical protein